MSILRGLSAERRSSAQVLLSQAAIPPPGFYYPTDANETVNTDSAMRLAAVWSCVNLLTDIVAPLPWHAYRRNPDGTESMIADHPLLVSPSNEPALTAADWRGQMMRSLLLRGNCFGLIKKVGAFGEPTQIQLIHPDYVSVVRLGPLGPFEYRVLGERKDLWQAGGDLLHIPAYTVPGTPRRRARRRPRLHLGVGSGERVAVPRNHEVHGHPDRPHLRRAPGDDRRGLRVVHDLQQRRVADAAPVGARRPALDRTP